MQRERRDVIVKIIPVRQFPPGRRTGRVQVLQLVVAEDGVAGLEPEEKTNPGEGRREENRRE